MFFSILGVPCIQSMGTKILGHKLIREQFMRTRWWQKRHDDDQTMVSPEFIHTGDTISLYLQFCVYAYLQYFVCAYFAIFIIIIYIHNNHTLS